MKELVNMHIIVNTDHCLSTSICRLLVKWSNSCVTISIDLMAMMFECSDLSAPNKAKTFHKPSLKELPPTQHHHQTFQQSRHAHRWRQEEDLTKLFVAEGLWCPPIIIYQYFDVFEYFYYVLLSSFLS